MNWKKGIGYGVLIWAIMFIVICILIGFKISLDSTFMNLVVTLISAIAVLIITGYVAPKNVGQALSYGLLWAVVGIILDFIISARFAPGMFKEAYYWLSYLLIVILPLLRIKKMTSEAPNLSQNM